MAVNMHNTWHSFACLFTAGVLPRDNAGATRASEDDKEAKGSAQSTDPLMGGVRRAEPAAAKGSAAGPARGGCQV